MRDGKFTEAEREYLMSLDAVDDVRGGSIHYSDRFRIEAMARYRSGERPKAIFESAGLLVEMVGYKRIERSVARWRENDLEDILARNLDASAPDRESARSHRRGTTRMSSIPSASSKRTVAVRLSALSSAGMPKSKSSIKGTSLV